MKKYAVYDPLCSSSAVARTNTDSPARNEFLRAAVNETSGNGQSSYLLLILMAAILGLAAPASDAAVTNCPSRVEAQFPTSGPSQTQWEMCYQVVDGHGLMINQAHFKRSQRDPWIKVLGNARLSEIFVPYHDNSARFFDVSEFFFSLLTLRRADCPLRLGGVLLAEGRVCQEIRDRGLAWKDDDIVRRGEELVLWGVIDAGNYNYIVEWTFQDDGTIIARAGSTGPKLRGPEDTVGHMHTFTWRLDIDLNGSGGDSVWKASHKEPCRPGNPYTACERESLLEVEQGFKWNPAEFTTLKISDSALVNGNGRRTEYELLPFRSGNARHVEAYSNNDFWVTRRRPGEVFAPELPIYVANRETVSNANVVIWYTASAHHGDHMRDEDRDTVPVKWVGFTLEAQNLFDRTPLYR